MLRTQFAMREEMMRTKLSPSPRASTREPQTQSAFSSAALFQFANPKAWVMAITGASAFLPVVQPLWLAIAVFCLVFCAVNLPCISVWAGTGAALLRRGQCEGCRETLSTVERNAIRAAAVDEVVRHEECGRILIRTGESGL